MHQVAVLHVSVVGNCQRVRVFAISKGLRRCHRAFKHRFRLQLGVGSIDNNRSELMLAALPGLATIHTVYGIKHSATHREHVIE